MIKTYPIDSLTIDNYNCPKGEEDRFHCRVEVKQFDPNTGERLSKPSIAKYEAKAFRLYQLNSLHEQGYTVTVLHDADAYAKKQEELNKAAAEKAEKERKEKEAADKAAAEEEAKKEKAAAEKAEAEAKEAADKAAAEEEERAKKLAEADAKAKELEEKNKQLEKQLAELKKTTKK